MKAQNVLLWCYLLILGYLTLILAESNKLPAPALNSTIQSSVAADTELVANDTSTAEQILDYLIENNSAVNFALKRGNNKRKQQVTDEKRDSINNKPLSLDDQINNRITSYLIKKSDKLKNVTALEMKVNETFNEVKGKENSVLVTVEKPSPSLPPFFSNAYNRVVHLLGNNKTEGSNSLNMNDMPPKPPKPTEEEILAMTSPTIEITKQKIEITSKPLILEETINEIGSQLIGKFSTKAQEIKSTTSTLPISTTSKKELVIQKDPIVSDDRTTVAVPVTTSKTTTVKKAAVTTTTTERNTIQKLGDRVGGLLQRLGVNKGKTDKPAVINNRYTYTYETPTTPNPPTTKPVISSIVNDVLPNNIVNEETVESINNVQSFLQQFGVTLNNNFAAETTTVRTPEEMMSDDENMRLPTTFRTTRRPYPWTTTRYRPANGAQTIPSDFEEMETTTRGLFQTSFWSRRTPSTV